MRPWKRRLSDDERSVLLSELLLRHPELVAEAEEITSALLVVADDQELADEITARLRALRASGPVPVDTGRGRVLDVLQPYIDDLIRRNERGARRAAADIAIAVLFGLYECREDTDEDLLLVRMGLPGAADDLARIVYAKVKPLHLSLSPRTRQAVRPSSRSPTSRRRTVRSRPMKATDTDGGAGMTITTKTMTSTPAARVTADASTTSRS